MAKKLLEESTVRRFMKIAGIQPLTENFVDTMQEEAEEEGPMQEEVEEEGPMQEAETEEEAPMEEAYNEGDEQPEMDMESPNEQPEEEGGDEEVDLVDDEMGSSMDEDQKVELLQKLAQALGIDVEVEGDDAEEPEMDMEEPAEQPEEGGEDEEMEEPLEEGEHMEEPAKDPAGHSLESPETVDDADSKDSNQDPKVKEQDPMKAGPHMMSEAFKKKLVEQVAKRVSARLKEIK